MGLSVRQFVHRHHLQKPGDCWESSEIIDEHFGVKWRSDMHNGRRNGFSGYCFYKCLETANLTGAQVSVTARCFSGKANVHEQHFDQRPLESPGGHFVIYIVINTREQLDSYLELTFRVTAQFPLVDPLPPRKKTWDFSVSGLTDVVLKVRDEKFHVSKMTLATHSSYFNSLFFGPFCESEKTEIELQEVNPETFQAFLQIFYHSADIDEDNVENLLEMARMYDVQLVTDHCEKFLKREIELGEEEKRRLCEEYNLKYEKPKEVLMRPYFLARDGHSSSN